MSESRLVLQVKRALLPYLVLRQLQEEPAHGYLILARLEQLGVHGVKSGTLYPLLRSMGENGEVTSHWQTADSGPARKVFQLSDQGIAAIELLTEWFSDLDFTEQDEERA